MANLSAADVLAALRLCEADLIGFTGDKWPRIEPRYRELFDRLANSTGPTQMLAAAEIVDFFAPFNAARERLNAAIAAQSEAGRVLIGLADMADQLSLGSPVGAQFRAAAQPGGRQRFVWQSSPTKATSLKIENVILTFEVGAFADFVLGIVITATKDVLGDARSILQAAGLLAILAGLYKATTIKMDEREATVFCGCARAPHGPDGGVPEEVILAHANAVRHGASLKPLDREELGNALYKLAEIKSVARVEAQTGTWRIIEQHNVKPRM